MGVDDIAVEADLADDEFRESDNNSDFDGRECDNYCRSAGQKEKSWHSLPLCGDNSGSSLQPVPFPAVSAASHDSRPSVY